MSNRENKEIFKEINNNGRNIKLIIDFSQLTIRYTFAQAKELAKENFKNWNMLKHTILNGVIQFKKRLPKNTEVIFACDTKVDKKYWRHDVFPNYKVKRKSSQGEVPIDIMFNEIKYLEHKIKELFPWKVIRVGKCEADDIIGVIVNNFKRDNTVIYSSDRDFFNLVKNQNCYMYDPMKKIFIEQSKEGYNPQKYGFHHILTGDKGDGIPNIKSDINTFAEGTRQTPIRKAKINDLYYVFKEEGEEKMLEQLSNDEVKRYLQNKQLIDLTQIPQDLQDEIMNVYEKAKPNTNQNELWKWLMQNNFKVISENFQDIWN
jgi:5'-3' exonuclease